MPDAAITSQWPANYAFVWIAAHIQPYVQGQADMYQVYMYISSYPVGLVRLFWAALRVLVLVLFEGFGYTSATSARADRHVPRVLRIRGGSGRCTISRLTTYQG